MRNGELSLSSTEVISLPVDHRHPWPALGNALLGQAAAEDVDGSSPGVPTQNESEQVFKTAWREEVQTIVRPEPDGDAGARLGPGADGVGQRGQRLDRIAEDALVPGVDQRLILGLPRR